MGSGELDDEFLNKVRVSIIKQEGLRINEELGADTKFIKQRSRYLEKFLEKISTPKEKTKKRVALPIAIESKYRSGAVMIFRYLDGMWGAIISVEGKFYNKETYYRYIQTDTKMDSKPTMEDVLKAHIIDPIFLRKERD